MPIYSQPKSLLFVIADGLEVGSNVALQRRDVSQDGCVLVHYKIILKVAFTVLAINGVELESNISDTWNSREHTNPAIASHIQLKVPLHP